MAGTLDPDKVVAGVSISLMEDRLPFGSLVFAGGVIMVMSLRDA